jgi:hypothetical protein
VEVCIEGDDSAAVDQTRIRVQSSADRLEVDTYSAATTVTALNGPLQFEAYSANLTADRIGGALEADTYSGTVRAARSDGTLTMDTYSGDLHADSLAGAVAFTSYSGSATVGFAALTADSRFESFSGTVDATLPSEGGAVSRRPPPPSRPMSRPAPSRLGTIASGPRSVASAPRSGSTRSAARSSSGARSGEARAGRTSPPHKKEALARGEEGGRPAPRKTRNGTAYGI